ncbi:MAG: sulfurtransferase TusA family protein [Deltaproteobacteria bacterium]|nr:sulfurtransferase TusA family protein [Deltaproteobacteria bacterium]
MANERSASGSTSRKLLDLRGEVCPYTFVKSKLTLEQMAPGEELVVTVDYEPSSRNIPKSMRIIGEEVVSVAAKDDGTWEIVLRKA